MLLEVDHLRTHYATSAGWLRSPRAVRAVDDVSFTVAAGETVGLVGESGCGKSTLVRTLLGLERPTAGSVRFDGEDVTGASGATLRRLRRNVQMVFQDPYGSLNPRMTVRTALAEVLRANTRLRGAAMTERIDELLALVGLGPEHAPRLPNELSGGQRQRLGIARALAVQPKLLLADEPVSALDVSVQAQIINLFKELQQRLGLAYLFIAHDLAVVEHISARVLVMYLGRIVETATAAELYRAPQHPYTKALLATVPVPDPDAPPPQSTLKGEVPSPSKPPTGCAFHPRCPMAEVECCRRVPELQPLPGDPTHLVACPLVPR